MFNKFFKIPGFSLAPPERGEVDPIEEANVYLAYGRDVQAVEILSDAITRNPDHIDCYFKLIHILVHRKDTTELDYFISRHETKLKQANPARWLEVQDLILRLKAS